MKKLFINDDKEGMEAERIVVDRTKGTVIGYIAEQEAFALRGVDFAQLKYYVEGGEDLPEPSVVELSQENASLLMELASTQAQLKQTEQAQADLLLQLVEKGVI